MYACSSGSKVILLVILMGMVVELNNDIHMILPIVQCIIIVCALNNIPYSILFGDTDCYFPAYCNILVCLDFFLIFSSVICHQCFLVGSES